MLELVVILLCWAHPSSTAATYRLSAILRDMCSLQALAANTLDDRLSLLPIFANGCYANKLLHAD